MSRTVNAFVLSDDDLTTLNQLVAKGKTSVRKINRARLLLLSHQKQTPQQVSSLLNVSVATVYNIRKRYTKEHLERSLTEKTRTGQPRKVTPQVEAHITSIACSAAPDGSVRWTSSLINDRLVKLDIHIHDESVRLVLKKTNSNLYVVKQKWTAAGEKRREGSSRSELAEKYDFSAVLAATNA